MSDTQVPTPPAALEPSPVASGFFQNLADMYFAPGEAFARIARRPTWVLPAVGYLVLSLGFMAVWLSRMEPRAFITAELEQSGQSEKLSAEQREQIIEQQARFMPVMVPVFGTLGVVVGLLFFAGFFYFVFSFFYGGELRFVQSLAVSAWALFAVSVVTTPLVLTVLALKGDWSINPQNVVQAHLGALLLDRASAAKPLWTLLSSIDLFSIWTVFLLASGYAAVSRRRLGVAIWGVVVPWAILILIKVGWSALF